MTQGRKEVKVGTLLPGNDKSNLIVNYLFKLFFVLELSGLNDYLKGYLKLRINKLLRKNKYQFSVRRCRFLKTSVFYLF